MSLRLNGVKYKGITLTRDRALETYDADLTPVDMQHGKSAWVKGKKIIGTGKCFEFVQYGSKVVREIIDSDGIKRYGVPFDIEAGANIVFVAPSTIGDTIAQTNYLVNMTEGVSVKIGQNLSDGADVYAYYKNGCLIVYLSNAPKNRTLLRLFVGKDNEL